MRVSVGRRVVAVHEGIKRNQLGELTTQHLGVSSKVVNHALAGLRVFSEVSNLKEAAGLRGRVHEEVRRAVQLNDNTTKLARVSFVVLEVDVLDVGEGVLDLVAGLLVIDVVGHGALIGGVEDDEVHHVLANSCPFTNAERAASQVVNHYYIN